jgi:hypothetical protein
LHLAVFDIQQAMVGDGDAVSVAAHIVEYLLGSSKGWFGIDDPFGARDEGSGLSTPIPSRRLPLASFQLTACLVCYSEPRFICFAFILALLRFCCSSSENGCYGGLP